MRRGSSRNARSSCAALAARAYVPPVIRRSTAGSTRRSRGSSRRRPLSKSGVKPPPPLTGPRVSPPNCSAVHTSGLGVVVPKPMVNTRTRRSAACRAASSGSTPVVAAPSVSSTTTSGTYLLANRSCRRSAGVSFTVLGAIFGVDPRQRVDRREHAVADRGADRRREPVDRVMQPVAVRRGRHQDLRAPRERHQTQARAAGLVVDELARRGLRPRRAGSGCTSVEHIDRETSMVSMIDVSLRDVATQRLRTAPSPGRARRSRPAAARPGHQPAPAGALRHAPA